MIVIITTTLKLGLWMNDYYYLYRWTDGLFYVCAQFCEEGKISLLLAILPSGSHDNWHPSFMASISWPIISEITIIQTQYTKSPFKLLAIVQNWSFSKSSAFSIQLKSFKMSLVLKRCSCCEIANLTNNFYRREIGYHLSWPKVQFGWP